GGRRERALGGAGIAVGAEHVRHLAARGDPLGNDAARADLGVVGMGEHHHGSLGDVAHDREPGLAWHGAHSTGAREYTLALGNAVTQAEETTRWLTCSRWWRRSGPRRARATRWPRCSRTRWRRCARRSRAA